MTPYSHYIITTPKTILKTFHTTLRAQQEDGQYIYTIADVYDVAKAYPVPVVVGSEEGKRTWENIQFDYHEQGWEPVGHSLRRDPENIMLPEFCITHILNYLENYIREHPDDRIVACCELSYECNGYKVFRDIRFSYNQLQQYHEATSKNRWRSSPKPQQERVTQTSVFET